VGESITTGQYLQSPNKMYLAVQQKDGNLCIYRGTPQQYQGGAFWCHNQVAPGGQFVTILQTDGNLCTWRGNPRQTTTWCTNKVLSMPGAQFTLSQQDDGNLCVYSRVSIRMPITNQTINQVSAIWCALSTPPSIATIQPYGTAKTVRAAIPGYAGDKFPGNQPCPTDQFVVPADVHYVRITAAGGAGVGGDSQNVVNNIVGIAGFVAGSDMSAPSSITSWANISGGSGGRGATVTATFAVTPGQTLYLVAGMPGQVGMKSSRGIYSSGFPGGGYGFDPGGGYSMVTTTKPTRNNDPNVCFVDKGGILVIAGGGGGGGLSAGAGFGGSGGDAGLLNSNAKAGGSGGGALSGGGGGGGTQTGGGGVGSHPGCGSEARYDGGYLWGSFNGGYGGAGGGGLYGGGAGGSGDCFLNTGHGGGGGGSSYVIGTAITPSSAIDTANDAKVVIQPLK
jgi:hypothetical protein